MSNPRTPAFTPIAATELAAVTGGRRAASSSTSSATNDRMMDMLTTIEGAIKDLGNTPKQPDAMSQMMPILALSMMNQPAAPPPPVICCSGGKRRRC
ncbi:MAG: hypothetical protein R3B06_05175 [Kofleriaceae bacterium]